MAKASGQRATIAKDRDSSESNASSLPPWRQPPIAAHAFQNVFAEHMANQLPGMLAQCTGIANATTGQSSEFGDLWKSWTKDAPCCC